MTKKKTFKKITSKFFCFILLALFSISTAFVTINASGIEYGEDDTIFTFNLNRDYLDFVAENFPDDFSYYFTLPIQFSIGNADGTENNLSVRITNGVVADIWYESLTNLGMPYDAYFVENGSWTDEDVMTDIAFAEGIKIRETYINDLYNYNFQMNDIRDYDNYINRFYQYLAINNLLTIKLNTFRFKSDLEEIFRNYDTTFYNISQVYVNDTDESLKIVGLTIGGDILDTNGVSLNIPLPKISYITNNEKYNELVIYSDTDNNVIEEIELRFNNFVPYDFNASNSWINNNYKFLTIYNDIGIMDYLNLSIYGDFNVMQFWVDPDTDATFNDLFTGIANVPIIVLSNLLSFSVFGWTGFAVLTGIITLLVIVWLIRKLTH